MEPFSVYQGYVLNKELSMRSFFTKRESSSLIFMVVTDEMLEIGKFIFTLPLLINYLLWEKTEGRIVNLLRLILRVFIILNSVIYHKYTILLDNGDDCLMLNSSWGAVKKALPFSLNLSYLMLICVQPWPSFNSYFYIPITSSRQF